MLQLSVLRWGQPYTSLDADVLKHFATGEPIATVGRANGGLIQRDIRKAQRARDLLREIPIAELVDPGSGGPASSTYANAELPIGDGSQTLRRSSSARSRARPACPSVCAART